MIHKKNKVLISCTPDFDLLFIKKTTRNGRDEIRLATFLDYDGISEGAPSSIRISADFATFLREKLDRLRPNEVISIEITTYQKGY